MSKKPGRNDICDCGSGLKYKKCCWHKDNSDTTPIVSETKEQREHKAWIDRVSKLPFRAEIRSENGASGSLTVHSSSITKYGKTTELFNDSIALTTNTTAGDNTENSFAILSVPQDKETPSEIFTDGNASVTNSNNQYQIKIKDDKKKLKLKSKNGLFATIQIVFRRDCQFECFDILFGESGKEEPINEQGIKQRPHLTIFPDGNNKFFRLVGYKCKMESELQYNTDNKTIYPITSCITLEDYAEQLKLDFIFIKPDNTVQLESAEFS